ncbi:MAG: 3D domain-containing protein [Dehalobacter sp.]|nr:3D domain-containing protein [Dehalobacter sp.]
MKKDIRYLIVSLIILIVVGFFPLLGFISMSQQISILRTENQLLKEDLQKLKEEHAKLKNSQTELDQSVDSFLDTWKIGIFEASAYSPLDDRNGLNSWGDGTAMTSGVSTAENIDSGVSVDPSIIPLGSKVYIKGIGWRVATDTGGDIQGYKLDIPVDTFEEGIIFGRKDVIVVWQQKQPNQQL